MKLRTLPLTLLCTAWIIPAAAEPLSAPSTLPDQSAAGEIDVAPPGALPMPVLKPRRNTPAYAPAEAVVASEAETHTLIDVNDVRFKGLDLPRLKQNLASRFATLALDETDRAELKLDARAFQHLLTPAEAVQPEAQSESSRPFNQAPRVKMRQTLPQAERRVMGLPRSGGLTPDLTARSAGLATRAMNPELWCNSYQQNQPRLSRVLIEGTHLTPGMAFVLKGTCLGQTPGKVEIRFADDGRMVEARVLDWAPDKLFVELPDVGGVAPGTLTITAITADRRMTQAKPFPFWPNWVLADVPQQRLKVDKCYSFEAKPYVRARCIAGPSDVKSPGYEVPSALFGVGGAPMGRMPIWTHHYSEMALTEAHVGWDSYHLNLPPWAHLQSWKYQYSRLPWSPQTSVLRHEWDPTTQRITSKWQLVAPEQKGFLEYWFTHIKAWVPAGLRLD
ncbi:MAG: hypothetical protein AB1421_12690 [Pseudomonadota bacterium]